FRSRLPGAGMTASPHTDPRHPRPRATSCEDHVLPERRASLWRLVAGPATWALHFLLCYVTAAVWCEKHARFPPSLELRGVLWAYTAAAVLAIALFGWRGLRHHRWGAERLPHDDPTAGDRHRFLGFATLLLCGLSLVAVLYTELARPRMVAAVGLGARVPGGRGLARPGVALACARTRRCPVARAGQLPGQRLAAVDRRAGRQWRR